jgi:hypothetical protein
MDGSSVDDSILVTWLISLFSAIVNYFLTVSGTVSLSKRILLHGVS